MAAVPRYPASFRDPSGFIFRSEDSYFRQVNHSYADDYELLMHSGLYKTLTEKKWLIPHEEVAQTATPPPDCYKTLLPLQLPFTSYAYEWSFDQFKDAALLTLSIMQIAVKHGMVLKDATPFNVQFIDGKPVFIDTLSFEKHDAGKPWIAYRQFCECFLFPLYLEHYLKTGIQKLLVTYLEGIPVDITAKLLPMKSGLNLGVWLHVHLQNNVKEDKPAQTGQPGFDLKKLNHLVNHLESIITRFSGNVATPSTWSNYYKETILSQQYLEEKEKIFRGFVDLIPFTSALDAGANDGYFSLILAEKKASILAIDSDNQCINNLYIHLKKTKVINVLPLCIDITNPSPALGFQNKERESFLHRVHVDLVTALALIHHLVLGKNIPLEDVAAFMAAFTRMHLIIEFVPPDDPKALDLIKNKTMIHPYNEEIFEKSFGNWFTLEQKQQIPGTGRIMYQMKKIKGNAS